MLSTSKIQHLYNSLKATGSLELSNIREVNKLIELGEVEGVSIEFDSYTDKYGEKYEAYIKEELKIKSIEVTASKMTLRVGMVVENLNDKSQWLVSGKRTNGKSFEYILSNGQVLSSEWSRSFKII